MPIGEGGFWNFMRERERRGRESALNRTVMEYARQHGRITDAQYQDFQKRGESEQSGIVQGMMAADAAQAQRLQQGEQLATNNLRQQEIEARLANMKRAGKADYITTPDGAIVPDYVFVHGSNATIRSDRGPQQRDLQKEWDSLEGTIQKFSGVPMATWNAARNHRVQGRNMVADIDDPISETGTKTISMPAAPYNYVSKRYEELARASQGNAAANNTAQLPAAANAATTMPSAPASPQQQPADGIRRVRTIEEAMALPAGTVFIDPDGRMRVR